MRVLGVGDGSAMGADHWALAGCAAGTGGGGLQCLEFTAWGSGFVVSGLGFRAQGSNWG